MQENLLSSGCEYMSEFFRLRAVDIRNMLRVIIELKLKDEQAQWAWH